MVNNPLILGLLQMVLALNSRTADERHNTSSPRRDAFGKIDMESLFHFRAAEC